MCMLRVVLYVRVMYPYYVFMLCVYLIYSCYVSILYVHVLWPYYLFCYVSILYVHVVCSYNMLMLCIHIICSCYVSLLYIHVVCPYYRFMLCVYIIWINCIRINKFLLNQIQNFTYGFVAYHHIILFSLCFAIRGTYDIRYKQILFSHFSPSSSSPTINVVPYATRCLVKLLYRNSYVVEAFM